MWRLAPVSHSGRALLIPSYRDRSCCRESALSWVVFFGKDLRLAKVSVLQKHAVSGVNGDHEARQSVQKTAFQKIGLHEFAKRLEEELQYAGLPAAVFQILRSQPGETE